MTHSHMFDNMHCNSWFQYTWSNFSTIWANSADDKFIKLSLIFFSKKMGFDISCGDNLHEMSKPIFCEQTIRKYFNMSSAEFFTQHAKH